MFTYSYKAKNISGNELAGQIQAKSRLEVITALKQKGFFLLKVEPQSRLSAIFASSSQVGGHVSIKEKAIFTDRLLDLSHNNFNTHNICSRIQRDDCAGNLGTINQD